MAADLINAVGKGHHIKNSHINGAVEHALRANHRQSQRQRQKAGVGEQHTVAVHTPLHGAAVAKAQLSQHAAHQVGGKGAHKRQKNTPHMVRSIRHGHKCINNGNGQHDIKQQVDHPLGVRLTKHAQFIRHKADQRDQVQHQYLTGHGL